jgi:hypothetical protein
MMRAGRARRGAFVLALLLGLAAALSACTNENPSLRIISVLPPANTPISFSADVQPIFSRSCAKSGCHAGAGVQQGLSLESGKSYTLLVGVASMEDPSLKRVDPGRSDLSYLIDKLEGTGLGDRMPLGGPPFLPDAEVQLIKDWIDQGAPNN